MPEYDYGPGAGLREEDLKTTSNIWRSHVYSTTSTYVPKDFVWRQVLRTEDYRHWLGIQFPSLPERFSCGTKLRGPDTEAIIGAYQDDFSLHLLYDVNLLVLEIEPNHKSQTSVRLCLDIFYRSLLGRMLSSKKKHQAQADQLLRKFVGHCQLLFMDYDKKHEKLDARYPAHQ